MKESSIRFKDYCNDENLKLYKKLKLYNVIKKRVSHLGIIDYDEDQLKFIGNNKLIGYYYGDIKNHKINMLSQDKFNTIYFMIFLRREDSFNEVDKLIKQFNFPEEFNLILNVDFDKRLKEKQILLLYF